MATYEDDPRCRGSWILGTACGKCERCKTEAVTLLPHSLQLNTDLQNKLTKIAMCCPPPPPKELAFDISDEFKTKCFDEVRHVVYVETGFIRKNIADKQD